MNGRPPLTPRSTAHRKDTTMSLALTRPAAGLALLAALIAGCGTAAAAHHAAPKPAAAAHHRQPAPSHAQHSTPANPIPQGNGGDQDPDNNGGPSDGDGNI
jgi:hypothetical protein